MRDTCGWTIPYSRGRMSFPAPYLEEGWEAGSDAPPPSPKQGAGGHPLYLKNVGGWARWTTRLRLRKPSVPLPTSRGWLGSGSKRARWQTTTPPCPHAGCRGRSPRRGYRGSPPVPKTVGGRAGGTTASATMSPLLSLGTRGQVRRRHPLIAKFELLCYSTPRKSTTGPLLFLGARRITYVLGANHRESPCGRGAEGTPQGARPSEEGWDRSDCRCKASSLERDGSKMTDDS